LLKLDQRAAEIFWMQKQHGFAMRADFRFTVAEHACALPLERVARDANIIDLVADVMNPAVGVLLEKFCDRRALAPRLEQIDFSGW
jgi:hypothetical protein